MKLLLTSAGFRTEDIVDACVRLSGKTRGQLSFAIINEGYAAEAGDKRWLFDQMSATSELFPGEFELVSLLAYGIDEIEKRLASRDVILVLGGYTDYLMHVFQTSGLADRLPDILKDKVYVGISAGAMILGKRVQSLNERIFGEKKTYVNEYMGLVDFAMLPHLGSQEWEKSRTKTLLKASESHKGHIFGIGDTQAIAISDKRTQFVGGKPVCASNGKLITSF